MVCVDVPDVNAEADDPRLMREQLLSDFERALVDVELRDRRALAQLPEIGQQVAQAEGGVDVFGVERREDDVRHGIGHYARKSFGCQSASINVQHPSSRMGWR